MRNLLIIVLLIATIYSCSTAARVVEKQRESVDSLFIEKKDVYIKKDSTSLKIDSISVNYSVISLLSKLNLNYDGNNGDSLNLTIVQQGNQIDLKIKGKGRADFSTQGNSENAGVDSLFKTYQVIKKEELVNSAIETQLKLLKNIKITSKEEKTTGFQFNFWIWIIFISVIIICLYWYFGKPKK